MLNIITMFGLWGISFLMYSPQSSAYSIPLDSLASAINRVADGSIVWVKEGTYENMSSIIIRRSFKKGISIKSEFGKVRLKGKSSIVFKNAENVKLEGFLFEEISGIAVLIDNSSSIFLQNNYFFSCGSVPNGSIIRIANGAFNNLILRNTFDNSLSQAISIITPEDNTAALKTNNNRIYYNYFCNTRDINEVYPTSNGNGMEAIMIGYGTSITMKYRLNTEVCYNLFENIIGDRHEIISNKTSNNLISHNTFLNCNSGLTIRTGNNVTISDNYFENTEKGIRIFGSRHTIRNNFIKDAVFSLTVPSSNIRDDKIYTRNGYFRQRDLTIRDNIIINSKHPGIILGGGGYKLQPSNVKLINNLVVSNHKEKGLQIFEGVSKVKTRDRNIRIEVVKNVNHGINKREVWEGRIKADIKRFNSNDPRVGASWRRPTVVTHKQ